MMDEWLLAPVSASIALLVALYLFYYVKKQDSGSKKMREIAAAIKEGANAFLKREYKTLAIFVVIVAVLLGIFVPGPIWVPSEDNPPIKHLSLALAYVFGSFSSALAGFFGMDVALKANVRTANAARKGLNKAFPISFRGGAVMGLSVVGLALLGISIVYGLTGDPEIVLGFSIGASTLTLFAKAGGGIYTKTADVSADLVGKVELGIPEDDPRNPAVVADNVGDNVGDVAGMGADLFDSYVACIMAAMILGGALEELYKIVPLVFAGLGIITSVLGVAVVRVGKRGDPGKALNLGTYITCFLFGGLTFLLSLYLGYDLRVWGATVVGLIAGVVIGITSDYYTSINRPPAKKTAESSKTGAAINILTGFSYGLVSVFPPLLGIAIASASAYFLCEDISAGFGVYGVGMSALGMLSIVGTIVAGDAYGPIGDNAKGIAEQSGLGDEVIKITDKLDAAGNTTKAISKGFAIGAAGLTALALLATYQQVVKELAGELIGFDLMDPLVMLGVFIGITVPCLFSALCMLAVSKNSSVMIEEIRRQFREIPGLKEGKEGARPDYASCVDIATKAALKALVPLIAMSILITLAVGFICGIRALAGYLAGSIFSGFLLAILMANSGGMWDNAKKYIEDGKFGGKGSEAHKAAVIGDTVGDPFKDTAGPSLNTLVTVISQIASLFAPLIVVYALIGL
ncbi:MAG: sodium-translocating pyrophosphatase [Thermoproteota archaeon]|nr:sodium-translocating pyrophosphatase [Thermoproteota archaeon]